MKFREPAIALLEAWLRPMSSAGLNSARPYLRGNSFRKCFKFSTNHGGNVLPCSLKNQSNSRK